MQLSVIAGVDQGTSGSIGRVKEIGAKRRSIAGDIHWERPAYIYLMVPCRVVLISCTSDHSGTLITQVSSVLTRLPC